MISLVYYLRVLAVMWMGSFTIELPTPAAAVGQGRQGLVARGRRQGPARGGRGRRAGRSGHRGVRHRAVAAVRPVPRRGHVDQLDAVRRHSPAGGWRRVHRGRGQPCTSVGEPARSYRGAALAAECLGQAEPREEHDMTDHAIPRGTTPTRWPPTSSSRAATRRWTSTTRAFGGTVVLRLDMGDKLMHGEVQIGDSVLSVERPVPRPRLRGARRATPPASRCRSGSRTCDARARPGRGRRRHRAVGARPTSSTATAWARCAAPTGTAGSSPRSIREMTQEEMQQAMEEAFGG